MREAVQTERAPAAVGPYSQAIRCTAERLIHTAGQIGMIGDAGIQNSNIKAAGPFGDIPSCRGIDPVITCSRGEIMPLFIIARVIGEQVAFKRVGDVIRLGVFHFRQRL